jgi:hypothetical protein
MKFILRVAIKGVLLYLLLNLLVALIPPAAPGGGVGLSGYNGLFPGRPRFPFGENPQQAYSFSLFDLGAMFRSHIVADLKDTEGEYRVFLLGDSSVWGTLLRPEETLAGQLNAMRLTAADGRLVRFYNLGYPTLSLIKDLLVLDHGVNYQPDLVIWLTTLEAFPREKQLTVPLAANNPAAVQSLLQRFTLDLPGAQALRPPSFWERTLWGRRKAIADALRLQLYGVMWAATWIDQFYPEAYPPAQVDLKDEPTYLGKVGLAPADLALDVLRAGQEVASRAGASLVLVNEPMLISAGANSDVRYNFYYPRAAYDDYRVILANWADAQGIPYLDSWDMLPPERFTNSAIHLDQEGTGILAGAVADFLRGQGLVKE